MKKIPTLSKERYDKLYESFLNEEQEDLESSEIVLGDSFYESPIKVLLEKIVFTHIKSSKVVHLHSKEHTPVCLHEIQIESVRDRGCFCGPKTNRKTYSSVSEFFQAVLSICRWHKIKSYEKMSRERQLIFANALILSANLLLK